MLLSGSCLLSFKLHVLDSRLLFIGRAGEGREVVLNHQVCALDLVQFTLCLLNLGVAVRLAPRASLSSSSKSK